LRFQSGHARLRQPVSAVAMPAEHTTMSMPPHSETVCRTIASTACSSRTSTGTCTAPSQATRRDDLVRDRPQQLRRSRRQRRHARRARRAGEQPRGRLPLAPPVKSATLPASSPPGCALRELCSARAASNSISNASCSVSEEEATCRVRRRLDCDRTTIEVAGEERNEPGPHRSRT